MKVLGKIKELYRKDYGYPSIKTLISDTPFEHQNEVVEYLKNGECVAAIAGIAKDVFTGNLIQQEWLVMSDGKYEWETNLTYYVEKYNLRLPDEFVTHVLERTKAHE